MDCPEAAVRSVEWKDALARLRLPTLRAITGDHPLALGVQRHAGARLTLGKLRAESTKRGADALWRNVTVGKPLCRTQKHEVPEGEGPPVRPSPCREQPTADEGTDACLADAEQRRSVGKGIGALLGSVSHRGLKLAARADRDIPRHSIRRAPSRERVGKRARAPW